LVDNEVATKKGVGGMVIKTGYKAFKALKPNIVKDAVDHLLNDFVGVLDKHFDACQAAGEASFESYAVPKDAKIADDLLGITDGIMAKSDKTALKKIYNGLRKVAEKNVAQAIPAVSRLIDKHMR
jgi:hypothetical protein